MLTSIIEHTAALLPELRNGLMGRRSYADTRNPSRDRQIEADLWVNQRLKTCFTKLDGVGQFASEEESTVTDTGSGVSVAVDPVDGSTNLVTNNVAGVIVAVYDDELPCGGRHLIGSFYALFGPVTTLVVARRDELGAVEYEVEQTDEGSVTRNKTVEFQTMTGRGRVSFGGRHHGWSTSFHKRAEQLAETYPLIYSGALIGDVNALLHQGGLYAYPSTEDQPSGSSRILFEANPISLIVEKAGGRSSDGRRSILDVEPNGLHDRVPLFLGTAGLVDELESALEDS